MKGETMKRYQYATADVFTTAPLSGNPVAVILNAEGLSTPEMQALAAEFNYVETTFVLPPDDPRHTAQVRIFTPDREVQFAGHPNIGTAFLLAHERMKTDEEAPATFTFEEKAGLVAVDLSFEDGRVVGAELLSPQPLSRHAIVDVDRAAACLNLSTRDVRVHEHRPQVISVGLPFLVVEVVSRDALRRAHPDRQAYDELFPLDGARAIYVYVRENDNEQECDLHARMFTWRLVEDPATGSATAAVTALFADLRGSDVRLRVGQGEDMGRPSLLITRSVTHVGAIRARVGGSCAAMFRGTFKLP